MQLAFIACSGRRLRKYVETKVFSSCFTLYKAFSKEKPKRCLEQQPQAKYLNQTLVFM